jgi:CubicO group peptidase (beta-lactamase class C family)
MVSLRYLILGAVGLLGPARAPAQSRLDARIDAYLAPLAARDSFAGVVLVARGDTVLFERAYGKANVESGAPNRLDTRFRIHSITKQFTAAAVILLEQRGKVSLDSSIRAYLPELPTNWQQVSVLHVLTHSSAILDREGLWFEAAQAKPFSRELDILDRIAPELASDTLNGLPGTTFRYSNFGYDLLACLVEKVSGERFVDFVRENVFEPAGMKDAGFDQRGDVGDGTYVASLMVPRLASGYNGPPAQLQVAFPLMFGSLGAGGMYATARDLFHYDRALTAHRLFRPEVDRANVERAFRANDKASYGFGWMVRRPKEGTQYLEHSGGNNGYNADYARYPKERAVVIVLTNRGAIDVTGIRKEIARILLGDRYD